MQTRTQIGRPLPISPLLPWDEQLKIILFNFCINALRHSALIFKCPARKFRASYAVSIINFIIGAACAATDADAVRSKRLRLNKLFQQHSESEMGQYSFKLTRFISASINTSYINIVKKRN